MQFQRTASLAKKAFLSGQCKETEENNRIGKTRDQVNKIGEIKEIFHARMGRINNGNNKDITEAEETKGGWQEYTEKL